MVRFGRWAAAAAPHRAAQTFRVVQALSLFGGTNGSATLGYREVCLRRTGERDVVEVRPVTTTERYNGDARAKRVIFYHGLACILPI